MVFLVICIYTSLKYCDFQYSLPPILFKIIVSFTLYINLKGYKAVWVDICLFIQLHKGHTNKKEIWQKS